MKKTDADVLEFGVAGRVFISADVDIDQSRDLTHYLSVTKNPEFARRRVFLKRIVDGKFDLYAYKSNDVVRYFYSIDGGHPTALVHKRYFKDERKLEVAENNTFRQQLLNDVFCGASEKDVKNLKYDSTALTKYFEKVNRCSGGATVEKAKPASKGSFHLKAGVVLGTHSLKVNAPLITADFGTKSYVSPALEAEFVLPFWNNKWNVAVEPTVGTFKGREQGEDFTFEARYKYVRVTAGLDITDT
jgi:hypothetical protein